MTFQRLLTSTQIVFLLLIFFNKSHAQDKTSVIGTNYISTAVPFLLVVPDSRAGGMGNSGVATTPDHNSLFWNAAKYNFIDSKYGVSVSYTPWLREAVDDMSISYLSGYYSIDKNQVLATSLKFFSLGEIFFQQSAPEIAIKKKPYEFAFDFAYSRKLGDNTSGAIAFRYIFSDISQGGYNNTSKPASAFATDLSFYHQKEYGTYQNPSIWAWGINISNIGSKIKYFDDSEKEFIPTNLRIGSSYKHQINRYNSISASLDLNKLLVPSSSGRRLDNNNDKFSNQNDISPISGIFNSFTDAPGGISEELNEITWSLGIEYWYRDKLAFRTGYFYEHEEKGNRKFYTAGLGMKLDMFILDFSYLIPAKQNNPLQNTMCISIAANLDM